MQPNPTRPAPQAPARPRRALLRSTGGALAALIAMPALLLPARLAAQAGARAPLVPTPAQTEGPFYPIEIPDDHDADLLQAGRGRAPYTQGRPAWVEGTLVDTDGRVLRGAQVEIWQCDAGGRYHHPADHGGRADADFQGFGRSEVGRDDGVWRFRTLRPVAYPGRTPHIHLKVRLGRRELLTTQLYVEGEPGNARDFLWSRLDAAGRAALTRPYEPAGDGSLRARYALVVRA